MSDTITAIKAVEATGMELAVSARAIQIADSDSYQAGAAMLRTLKQYLAKVAEVLDPIIKAAHAAHKVAVEQKRTLEVPALDAERILKGRMEAWDRAERDRLQAEQARLAAEAQEEARLAALVAAETQGDEEAVATIAANEAAPSIAFAPPIQEPPKAEGVSYRVIYSAKVVNLPALIQAVAQGKVPEKVLKADQSVLDQMARALKESFNLPGVEVMTTRSMAVRT